jgi:hypothetical protein
LFFVTFPREALPTVPRKMLGDRRTTKLEEQAQDRTVYLIGRETSQNINDQLAVSDIGGVGVSII